jgi:hypothetical protein
MKTTILLTFSFVFISGSLLSQNGKLNYQDSDIKKPQSHFIKPDFSHLNRSNIKGSSELDRPSKFKIKYQDYGPLPRNQDDRALPSLRSGKKVDNIEKRKYYAPYYNLPGDPLSDPKRK